MALKLMYITNRPEIARIAEDAGVDRIFVDMEYIGKADRQGGMDTVQSHHTVEDIVKIRSAVKRAEVLVRVNPIHEASAEYTSSKEEVEAVVAAGADVIMLPYFKTAAEVETFVALVAGRAKTMALLETPEAVEIADTVLSIAGLDEIYIGLNDLSLGYGKKFMFELLADGTVEMLCGKFRQSGIPYGFGGVAAPGQGTLPAERIIQEHCRLGSECVILSRSFCNTEKIADICEVTNIFREGVARIRNVENVCKTDVSGMEDNRKKVIEIVRMITEKI